MTTLDEGIELFLTARTGEVAPATVRWYRSHLHALGVSLGQREVSTIGIDDLRAWRLTVVQKSQVYIDHPFRPDEERGLAITTQHNRVMVCRILFAWLVSEGLLVTNPAVRLVTPTVVGNQEPKAISEDDIRRLHTAVIEHGLTRDHALLHCLAETGARVAGIAGLRLSAINLTRGELLVSEKGNKSRLVYLLDAGVEALRDWLVVRPTVKHDYTFTGRTGAPLTTTGIYQMLRELGKLAGVGRVNPHSFRHAFARSMLDAGLSLEAVSRLMGHSSVVVTAESYAVWTNPELKGKHRAASKQRGLWEDG